MEVTVTNEVTVVTSCELPVVAGGKGKRGPSAPLSLQHSSDEDEPKDTQTDERGSTFSPTLLDHDYENVSSPGNSSTASGPTYVRQPGFTQHAHEVVKPRFKKKKTGFLSVKDGLRRREPTPPKNKPKRDPLPMRMRALPQSFWQQPNVPQNVSPATSYPVLPPLIIKEAEDGVINLRPITPPEERRERDQVRERAKPEPGVSLVKLEKTDQPPKYSREKPERKLTVANTDLLFKLFDEIESKEKKGQSSIQLKRGRPRKVVPCSNKSFVSGEDPYLVNCVTDEIFPQLSLEQRRAHCGNGAATLQLVTVREGDKCVTLPSLSIEQNYPQMLSELVMHI